MASRPYDCAYCGKLFVKASEHASHVTKEHDRGFVPRANRTFMPSLRCWRCAKDMPRNASNKYSCVSCGFVLPEKEIVDLSPPRDLSKYSKEQP